MSDEGERTCPLCAEEMDEDQWMYDSMMSQEVEMNVENEEDVGVKVDCSDAFNTS